MTETTENSTDYTSGSRSSDLRSLHNSSFTVAGQAMKQKQLSTIVQLTDVILVNVTSSLCKVLQELIAGDRNTSRRTGGGGGVGGAGRILNLLGEEADIVYSEIRDGKMEVVMEDSVSLEENSSE